MTKIAIIAPVHIPVTEEWARSLELVAQKSGADIIIVDDSNGKPEVLESLPTSAKVFGYDAQKEYLGAVLYSQFVQFHKSAACKTFGMLYAYREGYDIAVVIDSDCVVPPNFIADHRRKLTEHVTLWQNPLKDTGWVSRGFPHFAEGDIPQAHMGMWENELDLWGDDRAKAGVSPQKTLPEINEVGYGFFPLSGMNVSIEHWAIPGFLFLPNAYYGDYHFTRHDDIWGGYIFQSMLRKRGDLMTYGTPYVKHDTIVVPEEDAAQEVGMRAMDEFFFQAVDDVMRRVKPDSYENMFGQFAKCAEGYPADHIIGTFVPAFRFWVDALAKPSV